VFLNGQPIGQGRMTIEEIVGKLDTGAAAREAEKLDAKDPFDVLVVGGGPAGAAAAICAAGKANYCSARPRSAFTFPRRTFSSTRRRCEARVGLVGLRGAATTATAAISARSRASASARFLSRLR
jgi:hypothetical protein